LQAHKLISDFQFFGFHWGGAIVEIELVFRSTLKLGSVGESDLEKVLATSRLSDSHLAPLFSVPDVDLLVDQALDGQLTTVRKNTGVSGYA
jgi:hypothetical protein